jgi:mannose-6-phosphate isomerase-like protein (cupin superfamily)
VDDFPSFVKNPANRIAVSSQHTPGVEGYIFDGADGSQVALWRASESAETAEHTHEFDEYFVVVEGTYFLVVGGEEVRVDAGQEYFIPRGTPISGRVIAGTRTIHVFGAQRARRQETAK